MSKYDTTERNEEAKEDAKESVMAPVCPKCFCNSGRLESIPGLPDSPNDGRYKEHRIFCSGCGYWHEWYHEAEMAQAVWELQSYQSQLRQSWRVNDQLRNKLEEAGRVYVAACNDLRRERDNAIKWKDVEKDGVPDHGGLVLVAGGVAFYGDASRTWKSGNGPDFGRVLEWQVRYWAELPAPPIM